MIVGINSVFRSALVLKCERMNRTSAKIANDLFPGFRVAIDVCRIHFVQHQSGSLRFFVMACHAIAIEHGSSSPEDAVRIAVNEEPGALVFEIVDSGRFVPRVTREGAFPEGGRGLEFMRLMMDEVDLRPSRSGTRVRLIKRLR